MRCESLAGYVTSLAALGDRVALVEHDLYRARSHSYGDLIGRAFAFRAELGRRGLGAGDRVVVWGRAGAAWAIAFYGCLLAGAVVVPVDAAFSLDYVVRALRHTEARLICAEEDRVGDPAFGDVPVYSFPTIAALPRRRPFAVAELPSSALLEIVYTSGATAEPKGVMITHGNVLANIRSIESEARKVRRWLKPLLRVGFVHVIPLSHLFGQLLGLLVPGLVEGRVIFPASQAPPALAEALRRRRASLLVCVPQQMQMLAEWTAARAGMSCAEVARLGRGRGLAARLWRWRRVRRNFGWRMWAFLAGGASLPRELEDFWSALGYPVMQGYGLTETAPAITATHPFKVRRGAVGRRLAEASIRVAADGEILVRGPMVSPGYYKNPEATARLVSDGWLHTGDLGRLDEEGNLIFLGRKKEVIVTGEGLNVYPQDVEEVLNRQAGIRDSAVVSDERDGQARVHAVLVPQGEGQDLDAAVRAANQSLEPHQRLRGYSLWPQAELPRTASTHKLQRLAIAAWVNSAATPESASRAESKDWRSFLALKVGLAPEALPPSARLDEMGIGSLDRVELLTWLETELRLGLRESDLTAAQTIADLERLISAAAAPGAAGASSLSAAATSSGAASSAALGAAWPAAAGGEGVASGGGAESGRAAGRIEPTRAGAAMPAEEFSYPGWPTTALARRLRGAAYGAVVFPVLRSHVRVQCSGRHHLRPGAPAADRPVLFIANHQSRFDVPSILRALPAAWRPWLAPAMGARDFMGFLRPRGESQRRRRRAYWKYVLTQAFFNGYLLAQEGGIRNALRFTGELADLGFCPLIFPEGQETPDGRLHPFRPGVGVFVRELGLPVVPILLRGLFEVLPMGAKWPKHGVARVEIGERQVFARESPEAITQNLQDWFAARLEEPVAEDASAAAALR